MYTSSTLAPPPAGHLLLDEGVHPREGSAALPHRLQHGLRGLHGTDQAGAVDPVERYLLVLQPLTKEPGLVQAEVGKGRVEIDARYEPRNRVGLRLAVAYEIELALEILVYQ